MDTELNKDALKKKENKVNIIMDTLNEDVMETNVISNPKIERDIDLDPFGF